MVPPVVLLALLPKGLETINREKQVRGATHSTTVPSHLAFGALRQALSKIRPEPCRSQNSS